MMAEVSNERAAMDFINSMQLSENYEGIHRVIQHGIDAIRNDDQELKLELPVVFSIANKGKGGCG